MGSLRAPAAARLGGGQRLPALLDKARLGLRKESLDHQESNARACAGARASAATGAGQGCTAGMPEGEPSKGRHGRAAAAVPRRHASPLTARRCRQPGRAQGSAQELQGGLPGRRGQRGRAQSAEQHCLRCCGPSTAAAAAACRPGNMCCIHASCHEPSAGPVQGLQLCCNYACAGRAAAALHGLPSTQGRPPRLLQAPAASRL